jgi:hypothetical protein
MLLFQIWIRDPELKLILGGREWPCNTSSENSSKTKTNTRTGKIVLKLVRIQSLRKISLISKTL